jgi:UDP-3-O-acyl-N-acetylglucosamine deacetylase
MVGWSEVAVLAGKCQQVLMAAIFALHADEAIMQISTIEIPVNDLLEIGSPPYFLSNRSS